jgi:hypothetical integral membrane protein (TIGR02206 family)
VLLCCFVLLSPMPAWPTEFHSFTLLHGLAVLTCVSLIAAACYHGRCHRETPREARFRHVWAWFVLAWQVLAAAWWMMPANFKIGQSLPLHICDLAGLVAGGALLTQARWLRTVLYFWGLALSTQAFITPTLQEGPADLRFWLFWVGHLQIIGSAIYDLVVGGYRPNWRDYVTILAITTAYAAVIIPFNLTFSTNYGYIGNTLPGRPTALDQLPKYYPARVAAMGVTAIVWMGVFWLIWPLVRRLSKRPFPPGRCHQCGYSRTGLSMSVACPECGAAPSVAR